ncbi:glycosyltransferase family 2 protein [Latilactobacillus curvatus]|uniref:glycosyltransferase family 2 protein n=1 Tax=Latilactobacillus curvatus TaxID=28038 RepID=UPI003886E9EE
MSNNLNQTVTISIVTYNSQYVFKTLDSIKATVLDQYPVKVLVHDNGSTPEYLAQLKAYAAENIEIIEGQENRGFGHGHNANLKLTASDYFLICNPDIILNQNAFEQMYRILADQDANDSLGMLTPKIVGPDGTTQHLVRRKLDVFDYMLRFVPFKWVKKLFEKRLAAYECRDLTDRRQVIQYGSGAFMFTRTDVIRAIDGFDERFFMYFEDNDLCDRINQSGHTILYVPDAVVTHFYGMASHRSFKGFKIFLKSMAQYFNKWGWRFF